MSSAQTERDFSTASLVWPSNRGGMDARYFQAQLCTLVNLEHPEDMSPTSMSDEEVSEGLPVHGFCIPDLYPERGYDDSHHEVRQSARLTHGVQYFQTKSF